MKKKVSTNLIWGAAWAFRAAMCVFAAEAIALIVEGVQSDLSIPEIACAVLMSTFLAGLMGLVAAILFGSASAYVAGSALASELAEARLRGMLDSFRPSEIEARRHICALMIAAVLFVLVGLAVAVWPIYEIVVVVQTPIYSALLAAMGTLGAMLLSLFAWPVWHRTGRLVSAAISRPPSPIAAIAVTGAAVFVAFSLFSVLTWSNFASYLPWRALLTSIGSAALFGLWIVFKGRLPAGPMIPKLGGAIFAALAIGGLVAAAVLPASLGEAGVALRETRGPLAMGYALFAGATDADGDGHLSWMGGGDCAPFDPEIHPAAIDKPDDNIDQNCDGNDSSKVADSGPGRHDYPSAVPIKPMPVILVTVDAVSALRMDLHGYTRKTMPRLTARAAKGVVFNWAFSEGPASRLSFPSLLSGRHNTQIRRKLSRATLVPWQNVRNTLGTVFAKAGYRTEAVTPDNYFGRRIRWIYSGFKRVDTSVAKGSAGQYKNGEDVTKVALARLDAIKKHSKFLLWVHYTDAHYPHRLPKGVKPTFGKSLGDIYDRELLLLDGPLDKLLVGIEKRMAGRDHVVALTADHGQAFDKKHKKHHQDHDLSTAVTWVPMIFWSPFSTGKRTDRLTNIIDVLPTLMNMVGLKASNISGDSLLPTILGNDRASHTIMQQFYLPEYRAKGKDPLVRTAVRRDQYVLHQARRSGKEALYDYRKDPLETKNLVKKHPEVVQELRSYRDGILSWAYESWNKPSKVR
ncbi:MAG: sulfatase-like hydrolase/transferase [Deltaproteobacteria bacterium]|nr:sulfatase-like hydrolase/transferase [Deltaproteobacteria bacterium]